MRLSVSVRIAEGFLSKEVPILPLEEVCKIAKAAGYEAVCMRASQLGVHSTAEELQSGAQLLDSHGLACSMVTGDFNTVYNNEKGPDALQNIEPYLRLANELNAPLVRVALKHDSDVPAAQRAADIAKNFGVSLVHQCHTLSLFETVESIRDTLAKINRDNFGLIYEPANLELCGQNYVRAVEELAPYIVNVYLQNQKLKEDGAVTLDTWCRGSSSFDIVPIHERGGVDFESVFAGLKKIGYTGTVTVHQSAGENEAPLASTSATADYLRSLMDGA